MSNSAQIQGIIVATLTPFGKDGAPDLGRVREHVHYLADAGIPAIAPVGTTGEFPFLDAAEKRAIVRAACEAGAGRLAVIAGVWAARLEEIAVLCRAAEDAGAAAVFLTTPIYYTYPATALIEFYRFVRQQSALPVFAYNIPQYSNNELTVETLEQLAREGAIQGVKDSTGKEERLRALLGAFRGRIAVYGASDSFALKARELGADGFISALANIYPATFQRIWSGDGAAQEAIDRIRTAIKGYGGISGLKYLLARRGFAFGPSRLPFTELDDAARRALDAVADEYRGLEGA
jgi:4-hydroxy-tetrahydrodipicolinate synthase